MRRLIRRRRRGQALVEFALVIPIFLLMLFGIVDIGRLVYLNSTVSQAAREGARVASVEASWVGSAASRCGTAGGPVCPTDLAELRTDVLDGVNNMMTPFGSIPDAKMYLSCDATTAPTGEWTSPPHTCSANASGGLVSVRVEAQWTAITPIIGQLLGTLTTAGSATMTIN
jgi:Flp pilus assembly protein TadG